MGRMHGIVEFDPLISATIMWVATENPAMAAAVSLVQNDIKKVLAYSTLSKFGFMFVAVGA